MSTSPPAERPRSLLPVYRVLGIAVPVLGALVGGLLAHHGDRSYEARSGTALSRDVLRGDVIAGALSGFMLAIFLAILAALLIGLGHRLWRARRAR